MPRGTVHYWRASYFASLFLGLLLLAKGPAGAAELPKERDLSTGFLQIEGAQSQTLAMRYSNGPAILIGDGPVCDIDARRVASDLFLVYASGCGSADSPWLMLLRMAKQNRLQLVDIIRAGKLFDFDIATDGGHTPTVTLAAKDAIGKLPARLTLTIRKDGFQFGRQSPPPPLAKTELSLPESIYRDLYRLNFSPALIRARGCRLYSAETRELQSRWAMDFCDLPSEYLAEISYLRSSPSNRLHGLDVRQDRDPIIGTNYTIE